MKIDINQINYIIKERRSIFPVHYSTEKVSKEVIEKMLENANWAPTHRFTEPWRFTVFSGKGIDKLAQFQADLYKSVCINKNREVDEKVVEKLRSKPLKCTHIISIGMKRDPQNSIPEIEEVEAVAMAVQNMYLTATAYGVGCYWGTGGITYYEESKDFFNLGLEDKLLGFLYIGMPAKPWSSSTRKPIQEKVNWVEN